MEASGQGSGAEPLPRIPQRGVGDKSSAIEYLPSMWAVLSSNPSTNHFLTLGPHKWAGGTGSRLAQGRQTRPVFAQGSEDGLGSCPETVGVSKR